MLPEGPLAGKIREIAARIKAEQAARLGAKAPPSPPIPEALRLPAPAPETPIRNLVAEYKLILGRLYALGAMGPDAALAECRRLLQEQMKLHDEIGPAFAEAIDRQYRRVWAARNQRCPSCGTEGIFHDLETGEEIPIDLDAIVRWTRHEPAPPGPEAARGWPEAIEGLGHRAAGPFTPCATCGAGTFVTYGGRPLCRVCAIREQT